MTEVDCDNEDREEEIYEQARDNAGDILAHEVLDERMLEHLKEDKLGEALVAVGNAAAELVIQAKKIQDGG